LRSGRDLVGANVTRASTAAVPGSSRSSAPPFRRRSSGRPDLPGGTGVSNPSRFRAATDGPQRAQSREIHYGGRSVKQLIRLAKIDPRPAVFLALVSPGQVSPDEGNDPYRDKHG